MNFCDIRATVLLQSYVIMPGGRLPETENKRICQISGPKSGRGRLRNLRGGRLRESFWNSDWLRNKTVICKWSFTGGGGLREVVAMRELTVVGRRASLAKLAGWLRMEVPPFILAVFLPCRLP